MTYCTKKPPFSRRFFPTPYQTIKRKRSLENTISKHNPAFLRQSAEKVGIFISKGGNKDEKTNINRNGSSSVIVNRLSCPEQYLT
jgi:hypothetical protein